MRVRYGIIGAVLSGLGLLAVSGCDKPEARASMQMPPPLVAVTTATSRDVPVYLDEIGKCAALESVNVKPQVAGRIVERAFTDGADLKKGQLLFKIDPRPFQAALDSAKAQLAQSQAAMALAKIQLQMYTAVADTRAISKSDFDTKKNAVDVAEAQIGAAEAAVETAQVNLDYCQIHSPIDGRAGARLVDAGNVVEANSTPLLLIQHLDPIYADFTVTERDLPDVQKQMSRGTLRTMVRLPADAQAEARSGELTFLDNQVQDGTGTVKLRATIPNADHHFWPGQFVNVRLILTTDTNAVTVPNTAVQISQQGPYMYVITAGKDPQSGTAELRTVTLGQRQGDDIVVSKGVAAGERVVVAGQTMVIPGGPVRIEAGAPHAGPAGPPRAGASSDATGGGKS